MEKIHQVAQSQCGRYPIIAIQLIKFKWKYKESQLFKKKKWLNWESSSPVLKPQTFSSFNESCTFMQTEDILQPLYIYKCCNII